MPNAATSAPGRSGAADDAGGSVEKALAALLLIATDRTVRVTDLAAELGVGRATAHRILTTMARRGFVVRTDDRRYTVGPELRRLVGAVAGHSLPAVARPHMIELSRATGETINLSVLVGRRIRFIESVEGSAALRVGSRAGVTLPAEHTSGGKVLLAALDDADIAQLYAGTDVDVAALRRAVAVARRRGYGVNVQETEDGITAVGVAVRDGHGTVVAGLSVAAPTVRYGRARVEEVLPPLRAAAEGIRLALSSPPR